MPYRQTVYYHITCGERECGNELIATADEADRAEEKAEALWFELGGGYEPNDYVCWDCLDADYEPVQ